MARIKGRDTHPELAVRSSLHRAGLRFRVHDMTLPGRPDVVLRSRGTVIFVHGCFWHRHAGCRLAYTPRSRADFWQAKFEGNVERDRRNETRLREMGWHVIVVWECESSQADLLAELTTALLARPTLTRSRRRQLRIRRPGTQG